MHRILKFKIIAIIAAMAIVAGVVLALPVRPGDITPSIEDGNVVEDDATLSSSQQAGGDTVIEDNAALSSSQQVGDTVEVVDDSMMGDPLIDEPIVEESVSLDFDGLEFTVGSNGSKHYSINIEDAPVVEP